ncbi:LapD/MoxY N-terminal periplasmic domain-containing protein [Sulfurimonas sp. HSL3-7]|uniref:bifunctional diguanylate cyclase/phosphodiesterase n=1 Tax=Sulfonitrofixus jiaomeiensis TaxID=3131938 RepID=UPI0031F9B191
MTLFKQTAAVLMLLMVAIVVTVLVLNFASASSAAEDELYQDAKNTATSLSLSLATTDGDTVMLKTMIEANFDSGRYHQIRLLDVDNNTICHQIMKPERVSTPAWFLALINIEAPIASANVFTGWKQIGILQVQSDSSRIETRLYEIFKNLMLSFGFILLFGFVALYGLFLIVLRPLGRIRQQAESIIKNEFIIQEKIPRTREFKEVVLAINQMVLRLKNVFVEANREMKRQKELAYLDPMTQMKNRKFLTEHFMDYFVKETNSYEGTVLLLELNGVDVMQIGYKAMETLFVKTAEILTHETAGFENRMLARLNETEFFLFLPGILGQDTLEMAHKISATIEQEIAALNIDTKQTYSVMGLYENSKKCTLSELLMRVDTVLAVAKFQYKNVYFNQGTSSSKILGKDAWREVVNYAIDHNTFDFKLLDVIDSKTGRRRYYALDVVLKAADGSRYSYDHFIPPTAQIGLCSRIHHKTIQMLFENPPHQLKGNTCSFKVSMNSLERQKMYEELSAFFETHMAGLPFKMVIEIPDRVAAKNLNKILQYKQLFERYDIGIALYDFIGENENFNYLEKLHPVYIKGDMNYFLSQSDQSLLTLRLLTESIGSTVIACNVPNEEAVQKLYEKGIFLIQGEGTESNLINA